MKPTLFLQESVFPEREIAEKYFSLVDDSNYCGMWGHKPLLRGSTQFFQQNGVDVSHKFDAVYWAPRFREHMCAPDFLFLDLKGLVPKMIAHGDKKLFVRSSSGHKLLAGDVYTSEQLLSRPEYKSSPYLLCMVSKPVEIYQEYRVLVVNQKIISGGMYMMEGKPAVGNSNYVLQPVIQFIENGPMEGEPAVGNGSYVPQPVIQFIENDIMNKLKEENYFDVAVDVGIVGEKPKLVELNFLNTSGWYGADIDAIYKAWAESYD